VKHLFKRGAPLQEIIPNSAMPKIDRDLFPCQS
jgi:hypothetical protein